MSILFSTEISGRLIVYEIAALFLFFPTIVSAYGVETHAALTQEAVYFYNYHFPEDSLSNTTIDLLAYGARHEDDFPRMLNHFYDPVNNQGLTFMGRTWHSSKNWIQNKSFQNIALYKISSGIASLFGADVEYTSGYTWKQAVTDYATGDTRKGLIGLGHVLHLIQDLAVPAHTRNDPHPPTGEDDKEWGGRDPYEEWTHKFTPYTIDVFSKIKTTRPVVLPNINAYFDELATYTNNHFYSKDTIGFNYYTAPASLINDDILIDGEKYQQVKDKDGYFLVARKEAAALAFKVSYHVDDQAILLAYWNRLGTKAIQYGAGLIKLFFDEVEALRNSPGFQKSSGVASVLEVFQKESSERNISDETQEKNPKQEQSSDTEKEKEEATRTVQPLLAVQQTTVNAPENSDEKADAKMPKKGKSSRSRSGGGSSRASVPVSSSTAQTEDATNTIEIISENITTSTDEVSTTSTPDLSEAPVPQGHVVISEVAIDMVGADKTEFIELYNPLDSEVDLGGYSIQYLSGSATSTEKVTKKNFSEGATIKPKSFFLIGLGGYVGTSTPDMTWSQSLNNTGATVFLVSSYENVQTGSESGIIDQIAYGSGDGLLLPETESVVAPEPGFSLERKAYDEVCEMTLQTEFKGNSCDTDNNQNDFIVRAVPRPQNSSSFPEPRSAPSQPKKEPHLDSIMTYSSSTAEIRFNWLPAKDFQGATSSVQYILTDDSGNVVMSPRSVLAYDYKLKEVNRTYHFILRALDSDGLGSDPIELELFIPTYHSGIEFFQDPLSLNPSSTPRYIIRIKWNQYPFIPVHRAFSGPQKINGWKVVVFYYNQDPAPIQYLGETPASHMWGITAPGGIKLSYPSCWSNLLTSALILPDTQSECPPVGFKGQIQGQSLHRNYLGNKELDLVPPDNYFGNDPPAPDEDFITVAFYTYVNSGGINTSQELVAIDIQRYYFQSSVADPSADEL